MLTRARVIAIAFVLGVMLPFSSLALNVSPQGVGQVLLFPYYTVNGGNQTAITIVNTTAKAKAVRVRFRESHNARPVLAFNVYLSPFDVWTAALYAMDAEGAARLITSDRSCTAPRIQLVTPVVFSSASYTGVASDHPASLDATLGSPARTREGQLEVIELGNLQTGVEPGQLAEEVTHLANGTPRDCNAVVAAWAAGGVWAQDGTSGIDLPTGGLHGTLSVIDVAAGTMFAYEATALTRFYTNAQAPGALHRTAPTDNAPDLRSADNGNSQVVVDLPADDTGPALAETFAVPAATPDPVTLALLSYSALNEYNTEPTLGSATEWVVTFPTKAFYTDVASNAAVGAPFTNAFQDDGAACEEFEPVYFDREERVRGYGYGVIDIDPPPLDETPFLPPKFCRVVNVLAYNQGSELSVAESTILGARKANNVQTMTVSGEIYQYGQTLLKFDDPLSAVTDHRLVAPSSGHVYAGLPVLGFSVLRVINLSAQPGILASYGGAYRHRGAVRRLSP